jgi:hypothetical protein
MSSTAALYIVSESKLQSIGRSGARSLSREILSSQPERIRAFAREYSFTETLGALFGLGHPLARALEKLILGSPEKSPWAHHYVDAYELLCSHCAYERFDNWAQISGAGSWIGKVQETAKASGLALDLLNLVYRGALLKMPEIDPLLAHFGYWKRDEISCYGEALESYLSSEQFTADRARWHGLGNPLEDIRLWLKRARQHEDALLVAFLQ